jgi:hypothetical protein
MNDSAVLQEVKKLVWFYQFKLPDGSCAAADYPEEILKIRISRQDKLRIIVENQVGATEQVTMLCRNA